MTILSHILVVDDDISFCQILVRSIVRRGYLANSAHNAQSCLEYCQKEQPDGIVLDLNLQGESGLRLIEPILQISPHTKILVLTGYASIPTAVSALKLGASQYLPKPANIDEILQALQEEQVEIPDTPPEEKMTVQHMEWEYIQRVLAENHGNISATAKALKMHRRTLQRKLLKKRPGMPDIPLS